jgi:hypothetical protein
MELDTEATSAWRDWAELSIGGGPQQKEMAAMAAVVIGALGGGTADAAAAASRAASIRGPAHQVGNLHLEDVLRGLLGSGWEHTGLQSAPFVLGAHELLLAASQCDASVFMSVPRKRGHAWVGGPGPIGLGLLAASAVGNAARTAKSAHDAAAQWRSLGRSMLYLTSERLLREVGAMWHPCSLTSIVAVDLAEDRHSLLVWIGQEQKPFMYTMPVSPLWFELMRDLLTKRTIARQTVCSWVLSDDGCWWWDGANWNDAATSVPPDARRSEDGGYWWDGRTWRAMPTHWK